MKKRIKGRKLGRNSGQRRALFRNLVYSLLLHGQLKTTTAKAKTIKPLIDKLLSKARINQATQQRQLLKFFGSEQRLKTLQAILPQLKEGQSGPTRLLPMDRRRGDNAPLARLELLFKKNAKFNPSNEKKTN